MLFLIDHRTLDARALPLTLRETPPDAPETTVLDPVPGRLLLDGAKAPDGYTLEPRPYHSTGILGDLFGMHSYQAGVVLINRGRVIPLALPEPLDSQVVFRGVGVERREPLTWTSARPPFSRLPRSPARTG